MAEHAADACSVCGDQKRVTFVSWYVHKGTKGHFLCRKHEREAVAAYKKSAIE